MYKAPQIHPTKYVKQVSWKLKSSKTIHGLIADYLRSDHAKAQGRAPWYANTGYNAYLGGWEFGIALNAHTNLYIEKATLHGNHDPVLGRLVPMFVYIRQNIANATQRMSIDAMYGKIRQAANTHAKYCSMGSFDFAEWDTKFCALTGFNPETGKVQ